MYQKTNKATTPQQSTDKRIFKPPAYLVFGKSCAKVEGGGVWLEGGSDEDSLKAVERGSSATSLAPASITSQTGHCTKKAGPLLKSDGEEDSCECEVVCL